MAFEFLTDPRPSLRVLETTTEQAETRLHDSLAAQFQDDLRLKASQWSALLIALDSALDLVEGDLRLLADEDDASMRAAKTFDDLKARLEAGFDIGYKSFMVKGKGYIHNPEWDESEEHGASNSHFALSTLSRVLRKHGLELEADCLATTADCFGGGRRSKGEFGIVAARESRDKLTVERYSDYGSRRSGLVQWLRASRVVLKDLVKSARQASEL